MRPYRIAALLAVTLGLMAGVVAPAFAGDYYDIVLANRIIGRLRDPGKSGSLSIRASQVEKNITEALSVEEVGSPKMWIDVENSIPSIYVGKTFLCQVLSGDLAGKSVSKTTLAKQWLAGFKQQFPRAEPVIHQSSTQGGSSDGSTAKPAEAPKAVEVPEEDKELVGTLEELLTEVRGLEGEEFAGKSADLALEAANLVWHNDGGDAEACVGDQEGSEKAIQSALNGLRFIRDISDDAYAVQKTLVAVTIVKRIRAALAPAG